MLGTSAALTASSLPACCDHAINHDVKHLVSSKVESASLVAATMGVGVSKQRPTSSRHSDTSNNDFTSGPSSDSPSRPSSASPQPQHTPSTKRLSLPLLSITNTNAASVRLEDGGASPSQQQHQSQAAESRMPSLVSSASSNSLGRSILLSALSASVPHDWELSVPFPSAQQPPRNKDHNVGVVGTGRRLSKTPSPPQPTAGSLISPPAGPFSPLHSVESTGNHPSGSNAQQPHDDSRLVHYYVESKLHQMLEMEIHITSKEVTQFEVQSQQAQMNCDLALAALHEAQIIKRERRRELDVAIQERSECVSIVRHLSSRLESLEKRLNEGALRLQFLASSLGLPAPPTQQVETTVPSTPVAVNAAPETASNTSFLSPSSYLTSRRHSSPPEFLMSVSSSGGDFATARDAWDSVAGTSSFAFNTNDSTSLNVTPRPRAGSVSVLNAIHETSAGLNDRALVANFAAGAGASEDDEVSNTQRIAAFKSRFGDVELCDDEEDESVMMDGDIETDDDEDDDNNCEEDSERQQQDTFVMLKDECHYGSSQTEAIAIKQRQIPTLTVNTAPSSLLGSYSMQQHFNNMQQQQLGVAGSPTQYFSSSASLPSMTPTSAVFSPPLPSFPMPGKEDFGASRSSMPLRPAACISYQRGGCSLTGGDCKSLHVCVRCGGNHPVILCKKDRNVCVKWNMEECSASCHREHRCLRCASKDHTLRVCPIRPLGGAEFCFAWNSAGTCRIMECRRLHDCIRCGASHPSIICPENLDNYLTEYLKRRRQEGYRDEELLRLELQLTHSLSSIPGGTSNSNSVGASSILSPHSASFTPSFSSASSSSYLYSSQQQATQQQLQQYLNMNQTGLMSISNLSGTAPTHHPMHLAAVATAAAAIRQTTTGGAVNSSSGSTQSNSGASANGSNANIMSPTMTAGGLVGIGGGLVFADSAYGGKRMSRQEDVLNQQLMALNLRYGGMINNNGGFDMDRKLICRDFNNFKCEVEDNRCRFRHVCLRCGSSEHRERNCTMFENVF